MIRRKLAVLLPVVLCAFLGACTSEEVLQEVPRDAALVDILESDSTVEEESILTEVDSEDAFLEETFEYAGNLLSSAEQLWYRDIKAALGEFQENIPLDPEGLASGLDETSIDRVFQCVLNDHPELFYVEGYSYTKYTVGEMTTAIEFSGTYSIQPETARARRNEIEASVHVILKGIDPSVSQYEKVKYVYDTIIRDTDYELMSPDNQNIYSVFVNHLSVCQGYAKATQYLLNRLGVECALVLGSVEHGEGHAWNLVRIDGSFYYVDTTWGDASYRMEEDDSEREQMLPQINYDYLNITTDEIQKTHTLDSTVPMPECIATEANYYVVEGALLYSVDKEKLSELFFRAKTEDRDEVTIKCVDKICYEDMISYLVEDRGVFDYIEVEDATIAYTVNDNQLSLTFWVTNE